MSEIIDHLASLTGLRDRDTLDVSLAHAMRDLLAPKRVAGCLMDASGVNTRRR